MDDLTGLFARLRAIQKGLTEFLETKRAAFPRLHYLSSEDLFEILGGVERDVNAVQPHLVKCFAGAGALCVLVHFTKIAYWLYILGACCRPRRDGFLLPFGRHA